MQRDVRKVLICLEYEIYSLIFLTVISSFNLFLHNLFPLFLKMKPQANNIL